MGITIPIHVLKRIVWVIGFCIIFLLGPSCGNLYNNQGSSINTVVLVSIDTWRWDANGFLGGKSPSPTPFLDGMASRGLIFANARTPVPLTGPSHRSMLSGLWPWKEGVRHNGDIPHDSSRQTLPELFQRKGWKTAAFVSCIVVDDRFGFGAGFDKFDSAVTIGGKIDEIFMAERKADKTILKAVNWLQSNLSESDKLFLWIHLFDPHIPYNSPIHNFQGQNGEYLSEVAFADRQLALLFDSLSRIQRPVEKSLWCVLSDHGEGLGDHGEKAHGLLLHSSTTRIPLLMFGSGIPHAVRVEPVSTVDLLPTILGQLGETYSECDGIDILSPHQLPVRDIPMETLAGAREFGLPPVFGLWNGQWLFESSLRHHLWNADIDPEEAKDLAAENPDIVLRLKRKRSAYGTPVDRSEKKLDEEMKRQLGALGYLTGVSDSIHEDVRDFAYTGATWHYELLKSMAEKNLDSAEQFARQFIDRYPHSPSILLKLGFISVQRENYLEAETRFKKVIEENPDSVAAFLNLGNVYWKMKKYNQAEQSYQHVLDINPDDYYALYNLGVLLQSEGRNQEAEKYLSKFVSLYPESQPARKLKR
ncbi:MAG TPA: sulfatase-like hydrolase/transferase [Thermoanaerobaculia bacterium]|nr:sulfatase-like hydrolase/transferase [Thermoanaerobaculia bacterium]HUM29134.1 sulfatase-like hydrolase/transferase [Thermoanaerobaculia bacterium]HXK67511.1 sulfatase-like hydrolase/transferase [Thermoanaerobaculia bacterium]